MIPISPVLVPFGCAYILLRTLHVLRHTIIARKFLPVVASIDGADLAETSIIVPIFHEEPQVLRSALASWLQNEPRELILVIDARDSTSVDVASSFQASHRNLFVCVEQKPGKRQAMLSGFLRSSGQYIIFVDSDVRWERDTLKNLLMPLKANKHIGGVGGMQIVQDQPVASLLASYQYQRLQFQTCLFLSAIGASLSDLQGRTAAYRRVALQDAMTALVQDSYHGKENTGGDDVFLSTFIQNHGWGATIQPTAVFSTMLPSNIRSFVLQSLRWNRGMARKAWRQSRQSVWGFMQPLRAYTLALLDMINAVLFLCIVGLFLRGYMLSSAILLASSCVGSVIPLFFFESRAFLKRAWAVYLYEHTVGIVRIYGILTARNQSWLTR